MNEEYKEKDMGTGFTTSDAILTQAMSSGNLAGGRNALWNQGGGSIATPWAVEDVKDTVNQQAGCINGTLESLTRTLSNDATNDRITAGFSHACDKAEAVAVRNSEQLFALSRDIDNKFALVTAQNHGLEMTMKDTEISRLKDDLAVSRDRNNISETVERTLATFKNCGCCGNGKHHG